MSSQKSEDEAEKNILLILYCIALSNNVEISSVSFEISQFVRNAVLSAVKEVNMNAFIEVCYLIYKTITIY